jgi:DNA-binding HxlR family transcriptional regulator
MCHSDQREMKGTTSMGIDDESKKRENDQQRSLRRVYGQIGTECRLLVLYELQQGERRFNELKRAVETNPAVLQRTLEALREYDFVYRRCERNASAAAHYGLTEKGESMEPIFTALERQLQEDE